MFIPSAIIASLSFFILSVTNGSTSFPKQLKPEQEDFYIKEMISGSKEARDKLIEHNLRLVAHICKKYYSSNVDNDDLISIGSIGLIKGVSSFNPDKGAKLSPYISRCIENEIHTLWNHLPWRHCKVSPILTVVGILLNLSEKVRCTHLWLYCLSMYLLQFVMNLFRKRNLTLKI